MRTGTLTILVTDQVGSTERLSALGARAAERDRQTHFAVLREELVRYCGTEIKTMGDGMIATFTSACQAIDCAVAMQRASVGAERAHLGDIRVGISSGDVCLDDADDCHGFAVVEAARLCELSGAGQVLLTQTTRMLARDHPALQELAAVRLKGMLEDTQLWEARWSAEDEPTLRAVIADDAALMREGIAHVLEAGGIEVVGCAGDADQLLALVSEHRPDLAIIDIRMPPSQTSEGFEAAARVRAEHPLTGVILLSMAVQPQYAAQLRALDDGGVGYLLKERVMDGREFVRAARRVAGGGNAFDPELLV